MGMLKPGIHDQVVQARSHLVFDDFSNYTDAQLWTKGTTGAGATVTNVDGDCGALTFTTGAVQNNEAFVATTRKLYTLKAGSPLRFQCEITYTEGNVNNAMIAVGFSSALAAGLLTNTTGVPVSPFSGCLIYKVPGETVWRAVTSVGATQSISQSVNTTIQPGVPQRLIIQLDVVQTLIEASFFVGTPGTVGNTGSVGATTGGINLSGMQPLLLNFNNTGIAQRGIPIKHAVAFSGAVAMTAGVFVKAGSATGEVATCDYIATEYLGRGW